MREKEFIRRVFTAYMAWVSLMFTLFIFHGTYGEGKIIILLGALTFFLMLFVNVVVLWLFVKFVKILAWVYKDEIPQKKRQNKLKSKQRKRK